MIGTAEGTTAERNGPVDAGDLAVMRSRVVRAIVAWDQTLIEKEIASLPDDELMRLFLGLDLRAKGAGSRGGPSGKDRDGA